MTSFFQTMDETYHTSSPSSQSAPQPVINYSPPVLTSTTTEIYIVGQKLGSEVPQALGDFKDFILCGIFSIIMPILSLIMVFGIESSRMSQMGVIFGTANSLLYASMWCLLLGTNN